MTGIDFTKFIPELIFVAIIVVLQFRFFFANSWKRNILKGIFPQKLEDNLAVDKDEEGVAKIVTSDKVSDTLRDDIIAPINAYLENNKGATDYQVMRVIEPKIIKRPVKISLRTYQTAHAIRFRMRLIHTIPSRFTWAFVVRCWESSLGSSSSSEPVGLNLFWPPLLQRVRYLVLRHRRVFSISLAA